MHQFQNNCICIITETIGFGGVEIHTIALIKEFLSQGYRTKLIQCRHAGYDQRILTDGLEDSVSVVHTDLSVEEDSNRGVRDWKQLLRDVGCDTLFLPKGSNTMGSIRFLRVCRRYFRRVFFIEHLEAEPFPKKTSRRWFGVIPGIGLWWYKLIISNKLRPRYADLVIAVSDQVKSRLTQDWGWKADKIVVVRNGVPWKDFARDDQQGMALRCQLGIPKEGFVFGMVTRLTEIKGVDIALRALDLLVRKKLDKTAYLVIAGDGPDAEKLKGLTDELNLKAHVRFLGFVSDTREALSSFDVILFSSRREGLPLALLEGMAAQCVPIVTHVSGMPEAVYSVEIGRVVGPESPEELCAAMEDIIKLDEPGLLRMRENALRRIQDHFNITECHRKILQVCGLRE